MYKLYKNSTYQQNVFYISYNGQSIKCTLWTNKSTQIKFTHKLVVYCTCTSHSREELFTVVKQYIICNLYICKWLPVVNNTIYMEKQLADDKAVVSDISAYCLHPCKTSRNFMHHSISHPFVQQLLQNYTIEPVLKSFKYKFVSFPTGIS